MKKLLKCIALSGILVFALSACETLGDNKKEPPTVVGQIAYNCASEYGYTLYITEGGKKVPYVVLTNNYQDHTLLLRKEILAIKTYSEESDNYYAASNVDRYLQEQYLTLFENDFKKILSTVDIDISCEFPNETKKETISRKAFLLSASEVGLNSDLLYIKTGKTLSYFYNEKNLVAEYESNKCSWYLRSAYLEDRSLVCGVSATGQTGGGSVSYSSGVRPAICVPNNLPIKGIEKENSIYYYIDF